MEKWKEKEDGGGDKGKKGGREEGKQREGDRARQSRGRQEREKERLQEEEGKEGEEMGKIHREGAGDEGSRSKGGKTDGGQGGSGPWKTKRQRESKPARPNIKYLTGDDKSNGNYRGKNIIRNLIVVKQNLHNTAN